MSTPASLDHRSLSSTDRKFVGSNPAVAHVLCDDLVIYIVSEVAIADPLIYLVMTNLVTICYHAVAT